MRMTFLSKIVQTNMKLKDIISIALGGISLVVALITGYFDAKTASNVALILVGIIWITWITLKLIHIENTVDTRNNGKQKPWIPYAPKIQYFESSIHEIDTTLKRVLLKPDFFKWEKFTILFWVDITEDFLKTDNNRYLFAYKTKTIPKHNYQDAFYLGILNASAKEGGKEWRLFIGGNDYTKHKIIEFRSNFALLGWKMFSITWRKASSIMELKIDAGKTFEDKIEIPIDYFPGNKEGEMFTIGGWTDWDGGLSYSRFYNYRIFKNSFTDGELMDIYSHESKTLKSANTRHRI